MGKYIGIKRYAKSLLRSVLGLMPINSRKIVVANFYGKGYGGNPKYIVEEMLKQGLDVRIIWLVKKGLREAVQLPDAVEQARYGSLKALYHLATAKVWIDNCRKQGILRKKQGQLYIQTWHAALGIKKIERDAEEFLDPYYIEIAQFDSKNCDLMSAGCQVRYEIFKNAFWYSGEVMRCGTPRIDLFFKPQEVYRDKVFTRLGIAKDTRVLLHAPTYRNRLTPDQYTLDYSALIKCLKQRFGGTWKVVLRLHPTLSADRGVFDAEADLINGTDYEDMQELLAASDILITDYSSCMFDMGIAEKPCFLHTVDYEAYMANERQLFFRIESLPFDQSVTENELLSNIMDFNEQNYKQRLDQFCDSVGLFEEGKASEAFVERIKQIVS